MAHVRHKVMAHIAELLGVVTHHTFLPHLFKHAIGSQTVGSGLGITVNTYFIRNKPPFGNIGFYTEHPIETVDVVIHVVTIDNPIGVVAFVPWIKTIAKQTITGTILVLIVGHSVERRPVVHTIKSTITTRIIKPGTRQSTVCMSIAISGTGVKGKNPHLLLTIETESIFLVSGLGHNTYLIIVRP